MRGVTRHGIPSMTEATFLARLALESKKKVCANTVDDINPALPQGPYGKYGNAGFVSSTVRASSAQ